MIASSHRDAKEEGTIESFRYFRAVKTPPVEPIADAQPRECAGTATTAALPETVHTIAPMNSSALATGVSFR